MTTADVPPPPGQDRSELLDWLPESLLALAVLVAMVGDARYRLEDLSLAVPALAIATGTALAVLLARRLPGVALGVVWAVYAVHLATQTPLSTPQVAIAFVAFACARWGSPATVVASGLSIPLAAVPLALLGFLDIGRAVLVVGPALGMAPVQSTYGLLATAFFTAAVVLVVPWMAGLAVRASGRARSSRASQAVAEQEAETAHRQADQAREIAALRDDQARLARDVHDVVGHSLAVILAQAESAQFLPDDPARLKQTLTTIATSARGSLDDVRDVLDSASGGTRRSSDQDVVAQLVAGVRASGRAVEVDEVGRPRPLPPELAVVAERVLQEMLTNAVKHGRRDQPIRLERHWPEGAFERDLRLEVSNGVEAVPGSADPVSEETQPVRVSVPGRGLDGMARRLEGVGGRLDVRRRSLPDGPTFTVTAWIPARTA